jgi:heme O synthase-like polyprenyltransferase
MCCERREDVGGDCIAKKALTHLSAVLMCALLPPHFFALDLESRDDYGSVF